MAATSVSRAEKKELVITRTFAAPRKLVWKAWTEPDRVMGWWGPKVFTAPVIKIDLRVGGKYLFCMRGPEGKDYWSTGTYLEVVTPERLVVTDSFADDKGNIVPATYYGMSAGFPLESRVTVTFEAQGSKTQFTMKYDDVSLIPEEHLKGMVQGWNESLDKLADYLAKSMECTG